MQNNLNLASLAALAGLHASTQAISIGFGQQIIEHGGNKCLEWTTWVHGESACPEAHDLTAQQNDPCNIEFSHWGTTFKFLDCSSDNIPGAVIDVTHPDVEVSCSSSNDKKVHCHGDQHDIIQKVQCVD
ncbi:hypothetical protein M409DRAFT_18012 [Zasmidium cellare ATCC 36951]|uniref:Cyanovirin-N domain-containing protein n=1 Tax=Zasmidium cellare ATCC 36951 TaxID=1080233 RepID=A0A6A6D108_ZASCE|nr:uncharacterized protein M409DRAFT_18012 [Zasmidium cellare ATCC 36951]KAF2171779.1 hypothetical protein M409DRAFT_18012 [Zasmidium cellare ATCC 36951]